MNLYNVLNTNTVTRVRIRSGSNFNFAQQISLPRILEFGVVYKF